MLAIKYGFLFSKMRSKSDCCIFSVLKKLTSRKSLWRRRSVISSFFMRINSSRDFDISSKQINPSKFLSNNLNASCADIFIFNTHSFTFYMILYCQSKVSSVITLIPYLISPGTYAFNILLNLLKSTIPILFLSIKLYIFSRRGEVIAVIVLTPIIN